MEEKKEVLVGHNDFLYTIASGGNQYFEGKQKKYSNCTSLKFALENENELLS